ncbi:MAG: hypothetical protein OEZ47_14370, partial [Gammaproteobacteria bacterium]|nr:hypothetical protein [Gammaproteobacteria bacterium]
LDPYNPSDTGTITYVPIENGNYQIEMDENGYDAVMGNEFDMTLVLRKLGPNSALRTIDGKSGYNIIQGTASEDWLDFRNTELLNVHQIQGLDRNDVIFGSRGNDTIVGGKGHDTLNGYDGDDTFLIEGNNQGSDSISGGNGFDQILGSADDDTISLSIFSGERRVERIDGGLGHNIIQGSLNSSYLNFSETELINIARIEGRDGRDSIIGSQGNDIINGGKNHDILKGHDGDDTFLVYGKDQGFDTFNGGSGYDQILGSDEDDIIGLTVFSAENRVEKIDGGLGLNIIQGSRNSSFLNFSETELINIARIEGMDGRDAITGSRGDDIIVGGKDHDLLDGHDGNDTFLVHGSDQGFDNVSGGEGFDQILGSEGDDVFGFSQFTGERRVEKIDGGLGYNFIHCSNGRSGFNFSETKLVNIARIEGMDGNNVIVGSPGNDTMIGHEGNDQLDGHDGIDIAVFQGNRTDFNITVNEGVVIIQDLNLNDGDEGSDTLRNFEFIQFSDQTIDLNTLN